MSIVARIEKELTAAADTSDWYTTGRKLPSKTRVYAIGDIHGSIAQLKKMLGKIQKYNAANPIDKSIIIFIGDYIDRSPDSAGTIKLIMKGISGFECIYLKGNHEDMLIKALAGDTNSEENWLMNGGIQALDSFGLTPEDWRKQFPTYAKTFLKNLRLSYKLGDYFFVHAGINPKKGVKQDPEDLLWIRDAFLNSKKEFGYAVVHGHTPVATPEIHRNRIAIDTGAVFGNKLTCAVFEKTKVRFFQT